jgi:hypothetical protein
MKRPIVTNEQLIDAIEYESLLIAYHCKYATLATWYRDDGECIPMKERMSWARAHARTARQWLWQWAELRKRRGLHVKDRARFHYQKRRTQFEPVGRREDLRP